jgi:CHAT domain-containing protein
MVWDPLQFHLGHPRAVIVAPDWPLSILPFAALPGRNPGSYLIEEMAIGYARSGREAAALLAAPEGASSGGFLAVGAVDFRADPGRAASALAGRRSSAVPATGRDALQPLPGTRVEGEIAHGLFRRAFPDQPAVLLTGAEPTEGRVKERLDGGRWRAVHLGTHGFFESPERVVALRNAMRSEHATASLPGPGTSDDNPAAFTLIPFLQSGLVLAGGGRAPGPARWGPWGAAPPREDGILTAVEVQSLDLRGTEMVVLSACDTGLGEGRYGQGLLGLQHAFHSAGARAVVASLWKVDDAASSVLMEQFYTALWINKMPWLDAMQAAQIVVLHHPELVQARRAELARRGIGEDPAKLQEAETAASQDPRSGRSHPSLWAAWMISGRSSPPPVPGRSPDAERPVAAAGVVVLVSLLGANIFAWRQNRRGRETRPLPASAGRA